MNPNFYYTSNSGLYPSTPALSSLHFSLRIHAPYGPDSMRKNLSYLVSYLSQKSSRRHPERGVPLIDGKEAPDPIDPPGAIRRGQVTISGTGHGFSGTGHETRGQVTKPGDRSQKMADRSLGQVTGELGTGQNTTPGQVTFSRHTPNSISLFGDSYSRFSFCGLNREIRVDDPHIPMSPWTGHFSRHIAVSIAFFVPPPPYFFFFWV